LKLLEENGEHPYTKEDGNKLAQELGAYCYMECSSLKLTGLKEIFEQAIRYTLKERNSKDTILSFEDFNLEDLEKYKTMRNKNESSQHHKHKARGKKGNNDESHSIHSIESIVAKNKTSKDHSTISDRYNLQTLLKSGKDIEAYSVYKKSKPTKSKKQIKTENTTKIEEKSNAKEKDDIKQEYVLESNKKEKIIANEVSTNEIIKDDSKLDKPNDEVKVEEIINENNIVKTKTNQDEKSETIEKSEDKIVVDDKKEVKAEDEKSIKL